MHIIMDVAASGTKLPFGETVVTALLGYGVVFLGLVILMGLVYLMGVVFKSLAARKAAKAEAARSQTRTAVLPNARTAKAPEAPATPAETAPGTAGEVKLFDVPDKDAAMIMAIVADNLGKPLNELRFKSIKEVK